MNTYVGKTTIESSEKGMHSEFHSIYNSRLFKGIPEDEFEQMLTTLDSQLKYYAKNQIIMEEGQPINRAGLLITGNLLTYRKNFWDEKTYGDPIEPDEIFCESLACSYNISANMTIEASIPSVVLWFNINEILNLNDDCAYHTTLIKNLMNEFARKNLRLTEKINHMEQSTTKEKLLSYLSLCSARNNCNEFDIDMNRQELADYLCVERSAMSNELSKLRKSGYLDTKRNHFILYKLK